MNSKTVRYLTSSALFLSLPAQAHSGIDTLSGLSAGLLHPFLGMDHLCIMLATGLWSVKQGWKTQGWLPLSFLLLILTGFSMQLAGLPYALAETTSVFALLMLGLLLWRDLPPTSPLVFLTIAIAAFSHGFEHAQDLPKHLDAGSYALGLLFSTTAGLGLGIIAAKWLNKQIKLLGSVLACGCLLVGIGAFAGL